MTHLVGGASWPVPLLGEGVTLAPDVHFGVFVVVHDHTIIGQGCRVEDHAVLGKRPHLSAHSSAHGALGPLQLGPRVSVGAAAILFAASTIGADAILGDQSFVRERSAIGANSVIGRGSVVDNDVQVGERVRVQTDVYLTAHSLIEDDVFIGPGVLTSNDDTMNRHPEGAPTPTPTSP
jgi:UDP-2-acetamido-3-amino-2,3-dideoxy-glucuronate N-acetyltransferase